MFLKKMSRKSIFIIIISACVLNLVGCGKTEMTEFQSSVMENQEITEYSQDFFCMDTYMSLTAYGSNAKEAVEEAVSEIKKLDKLWSVGNSDSEISIFNENGSCQLSPDTLSLVKSAIDYCELTQGAFNPTVYPLMEAWGFPTMEYRIPSSEEISEILKTIDVNLLDLDEESQSLTSKNGAKMDLGAIAKGYTSNRVMEIFRERECISGVISLGGNVQTYGKKKDGSLWHIGVENPNPTEGQLKGADYIGVLEVEDQAVITSGDYERFFEKDGKKYHHILDPSTGYPAQSGLISVTIVSSDGCLADCLSTALFVMGRDKAIDFWKKHTDEFQAVLISEDGSITITKGLEETFSSDLSYDIAE